MNNEEKNSHNIKHLFDRFYPGRDLYHLNHCIINYKAARSHQSVPDRNPEKAVIDPN